jgi:ABC-type glycerol-3-phosphate transport system substrate-binding protein
LTAPYPAAADSPTSRNTPVLTGCLAISSGSPNPHADWLWLNFLSQHWLTLDKNSPQAILEIPGRISTAEAEGFWKNLPEDLTTTVRYILEQDGYVDTQYADAAGAVSKALAKTAAGTTDFVTALEEAKALLSAAPSGPKEQVVVATPQLTVSGDITAINFLYQAYGKEESQIFESMAKAYNETHPEIPVNLTTKFYGSESGDYLQSVSENFDCFISSPENWKNLKSNYFLPLNSLVDSEGSGFLQDFDTALLDNFRYEGVLYALPAFSQPTVMVYNADLLKKRGLKPPSNDWTFDDYIELATKAASTSETDKSYGIVFSVYDPQLFIGRGVDLGDTTSGHLTPPEFDSPEFASALARIADLNKSGVLLIGSQENDEKVIEKIKKIVQTGQLAFWQTQIGTLGGFYFSADDKPTYQIGIVPMPTSDDLIGMGTWSLDYGFFISSKSKNPQLCWDWIKFLSEQPYLSMGVPARKTVASSAAWEAVVGKQYADVYRLARARVQSPKNDLVAGPIDTWRSQAVAAALNGEDYQKLLPVLQTKAKNYLDCMSTMDQANLNNNEINTAVTNCARQADPEGNWGP